MEGVVLHMDDILIFAESTEEHDRILREVLRRLEKEGITLNKSKCLIGMESVTFLGHRISKEGIEIDKDRVKSISTFRRPQIKQK